MPPRVASNMVETSSSHQAGGVGSSKDSARNQWLQAWRIPCSASSVPLKKPISKEPYTVPNQQNRECAASQITLGEDPMPILTDHHDPPENARQRICQDDPVVMYLVVRKGVSASPTEMLVPAAQATVRCINEYAQSPEWRVAFTDWGRSSFSKVSVSAPNRNGLERAAGAAPRPRRTYTAFAGARRSRPRMVGAASTAMPASVGTKPHPR